LSEMSVSKVEESRSGHAADLKDRVAIVTGAGSGFDYPETAPINLAASDCPPPMSEPLELASIPSVEKIVDAVKAIV